jgi:hypothetical protein
LRDRKKHNNKTPCLAVLRTSETTGGVGFIEVYLVSNAQSTKISQRIFQLYPYLWGDGRGINPPSAIAHLNCIICKLNLMLAEIVAAI